MPIRQIHWQAPATVVLALAAGALFAVGHHLFYASLQGTPVRSPDVDLLGTRVSSQQINITAGNVFAFLVNFSLGTSLATAYIQLVFRKLMYRKATLATWDAAYGGLGNVFYLGKFWLWKHFPLLCLLMAIGWLLPLATTIPPGTLSVGFAPVTSTPVLQQVPNVGFTSLNYVADMLRVSQGEDSTFNTRFEYQGPSPDVVRIADNVAQTGSILPIDSPYTNASWALDFDGPGLSCAQVPESAQEIVRSRLRQTFFNSTSDCVVQGYIAWNDSSAGYALSGNTSLSFNALNNGGLALNIIGLPHMMDLVGGTIGGIGTIPYLEVCQHYQITDARFEGSSMVQCQLRNVSYHVSFEYLNGEQNIAITTDTISEGPIHPISFVAGNGQTFADNVIDGVDCSVLSGVYDVDPGANPKNICLIDSFVLKTLSYQAIFEAFGDLVTGSVTRSSYDTAPEVSTTVQNTILVDTPQLEYLNTALQTYSDLSSKPLQEYIQTGNLAIYQGLVNNPRTDLSGSLIPTIEALFRNITVSMMSSKALQPNFTSAFVPAAVNVTIQNVHDVYVYSSSRLWLAYGIAIGLAAATAITGLYAIWTTGASYSQDFSTVLRIGRGALMSAEVKEEDMDGKDALPKYLEEAQVWLRPMKGAPSAPTVATKDEKQQSSGSSGDDMSPNTQERVVGGSSSAS